MVGQARARQVPSERRTVTDAEGSSGHTQSQPAQHPSMGQKGQAPSRQNLPSPALRSCRDRPLCFGGEVKTTAQSASSNFFDRNIEERVEIIEGILREGDIAVLAGSYGEGKSPVIADLTIHLISGRDWCGRRVTQRPIVEIGRAHV